MILERKRENSSKPVFMRFNVKSSVLATEYHQRYCSIEYQYTGKRKAQ